MSRSVTLRYVMRAVRLGLTRERRRVPFWMRRMTASLLPTGGQEMENGRIMDWA